MSPELHYQLMINRVDELHAAADHYRLAQEAVEGRRATRAARAGSRVLRGVFGKLRTS
ncbi:hypothetical protein J5X84_19300 [Streptosporangiaceae bacterium NEAU-GS5]|nr:hypothetical protein [Streptosporangiaceae bacterium NEAU-GS5]